MDETKNVVETETPELPLRHLAVQNMVGGFAGVMANHLAKKAYVTALYAYRSRKGS